jgi:hypothetical protein
MYVGYFGAAAGVMLLVVLSIMVEESLVKVNAVKNAVSGVAKAMAAPCFCVVRRCQVGFCGSIGRGLLYWRLDRNPRFARRVPAGAFRVFVSLCGMGLAVKLGINAYR